MSDVIMIMVMLGSHIVTAFRLIHRHTGGPRFHQVYSKVCLKLKVTCCYTELHCIVPEIRTPESFGFDGFS